MTVCKSYVKSSLPKEILNLSYDIDQCEEKVQCLFGKKRYCTPSCCCYCYRKFWAMSHKNFVGISKKRTANSTITEIDIVPRCNKMKETCVTERSIVDISVKKEPSSLNKNSSRDCFRNARVAVEKIDAATEPIILSPKHGDCPWGIILKNDSSFIKNSKYLRKKHKSKKSFHNSYNSTSSSCSQEQVLTQRFYTRNKGIQCVERYEISDKENYQIDSIWYLLSQMRKKLKGNIILENMLDELEQEIKNVFDVKTNLHFIPATAEENNGIKTFSSELNTKQTTLSSISAMDRNVFDKAHNKLEETCRDLEFTCLKLKKERDTSVQLAADKSAELTQSLMREAEIKNKCDETNEKIKELSIKLESYSISMKNVNEHVIKLQNESKELKKLKQQVEKLNGVLKLVTKENKTLLEELQKVTVERNKFQIALAIKEQSLSKETVQPDNTILPISKLVTVKKHRKETMQQIRPLENSRLKEISPRSTAISESPLTVPHSHLSFSSPSLVIAPSLYGNNSVDSIKTPSPSSDHIFQENHSGREEEEGKSILLPFLSNIRNSVTQQQFSLGKLENLKEEIKIIFSEIKQIADDIPSKPVIDFSTEDITSDLSGISHISVVDVHISDLDTN